MLKKQAIQKRRAMRNRSRLAKFANGRPRLSVHRSSKHIYAQVIDDVSGRTLAAASTLEKAFDGKTGADTGAAAEVGKLLAERAKTAGVTEVIFDRGALISMAG